MIIIDQVILVFFTFFLLTGIIPIVKLHKKKCLLPMRSTVTSNEESRPHFHKQKNITIYYAPYTETSQLHETFCLKKKASLC